MNECIFMGRMTADPEVRYSQNGDMAITRFRLAVERRFKREGSPDADFLNFIAFDKSAENIGKYFHKGDMILVLTHCQTGSYTNRDGQKVYTTEFVVDAWEFTGGRSENKEPEQQKQQKTQPKDGEFMSVPDTANEELPWD